MRNFLFLNIYLGNLKHLFFLLLVQLLIGINLLFFSNPTFASNLRFLNFAAMYYLCDADFARLFPTIDMALNHFPDQAKLTWNNPMTGAGGYVVPSKTSFESGFFCRSLKIYTCGLTGSGEINYRLCKVCGEWKLSRE